jgi:hypothetical protein
VPGLDGLLPKTPRIDTRRRCRDLVTLRCERDAAKDLHVTRVSARGLPPLAKAMRRARSILTLILRRINPTRAPPAHGDKGSR